MILSPPSFNLVRHRPYSRSRASILLSRASLPVPSRAPILSLIRNPVHVRIPQRPLLSLLLPLIPRITYPTPPSYRRTHSPSYASLKPSPPLPLIFTSPYHLPPLPLLFTSTSFASLPTAHHTHTLCRCYKRSRILNV
ncbi:uncharacterized protein SCHCODRAFT_02100168 [Schizophyllum commune H4-8]|uniref:uncharacterized protein n=1 Tax=Schizophyllum commune (strain H4-8 / FGSC 9210) TaxID=578458 RepID=UPI00215E1C85|nr:uncharacterized protein SCHCODRAFT_02100168 [Schizophyllum commune H4-8]KAI5886505.1 hypothetical protein SCHCODRAFT_02100168 [Schizophyllum commune H4-8]